MFPALAFPSISVSDWSPKVVSCGVAGLDMILCYIGCLFSVLLVTILHIMRPLTVALSGRGHEQRKSQKPET